MKAVITVQSFVSDLVLSLWTPFFVAVFVAIALYALWPRNKQAFDAAARAPLRED
jgi:cytochrome c oxidase cbb3-type subunit 4